MYSFRSPFFEIDSGYGKLVMQKVWKGAGQVRGWLGGLVVIGFDCCSNYRLQIVDSKH